MLIGATNGIQVIDKEMIGSLKPGAIVMDLGKDTIFADALDFARDQVLRVCRTDVATSILSHVNEVITAVIAE